MGGNKILDYIKNVLVHLPTDWVKLTTHRLDVYDEQLAKTQFSEQLEVLFHANNYKTSALSELPTAYDYIRLGHPLSCVLEWTIAKMLELKTEHVISFSSSTAPILAVLRKNLLENKNTRILYTDPLPDSFDPKILQRIYGYQFELQKVDTANAVAAFDGSTLFITQQADLNSLELKANIDFLINRHPQLGSVVLVNGSQQCILYFRNSTCTQTGDHCHDSCQLPNDPQKPYKATFC